MEEAADVQYDAEYAHLADEAAEGMAAFVADLEPVPAAPVANLDGLPTVREMQAALDMLDADLCGDSECCGPRTFPSAEAIVWALQDMRRGGAGG